MNMKSLCLSQCRMLALVISLIVGTAVFAQNVKRPESYNYMRGIEAYNKEDMNEALEYFNKDIQENPKSGYSYSWIALIRLQNEEYGKALTAAELAIKYLPKKDKEYIASSYVTRAGVYLHLEDTVKALNDFTAAIRIYPEKTGLYEKRAQIYYEQDNYYQADADYRKMIELDPGEATGYMGIGRNALEQKRLDDAISQFNHVIKMDESNSRAYAFRADAELQKEMWHEGTNDLITSMQCDWDEKAAILISELKEPASSMMLSKLKIQAKKSPNELTWPYLTGLMSMNNKKYKKAIEYFLQANKIEATSTIYQRLADCYCEIGAYDEALASINQSLDMDSTELANLVKKAYIYYEMGNVKAAIAEWDNLLTIDPESSMGYGRRGWYKNLDGDLEGAIEDMTTSIVLNPDNAYAYECRGDIYMRQGKKELAEADFKKVIEIENSPEKYSCVEYAYQGLGQYDKAIAALDTIIARGEDHASDYYNAACLYSRMKDKENALKYLEKSFEEGYIGFSHLVKDYDMDFIRDTPEYKKLVEKYKAIYEKNLDSDIEQVSSKETVTTEVPFTKESGVCKVKCNVNGLPLHFVFDTGASDVTVSMVEATFMMKNGYLSSKDVVGNQRYMDANGEVSVGTVINLKDVNFGGLNLTNVRASVVRNQKAPLLLGQSVLSRLGKIEIDNSKNILKITHSK